MVVAMDVQAGIVDEKMDAVKEYMEWRNMPRNLVVRVRKYGQLPLM